MTAPAAVALLVIAATLGSCGTHVPLPARAQRSGAFDGSSLSASPTHVPPMPTASPTIAPTSSISPTRLYLPLAPRFDPWLTSVAGRTVQLDGSMLGWDWEAGVALAGLMHAHGAVADDAWIDYVEEWFAERIAEGEAGPGGPRRAVPPCREGGWPAQEYWHPNHATPVWALLMLHEVRPRDEYLRVGEQAVRFLAEDACRVDGSLAHVPNQLWADTLIVAVPLLARYGALTGQPEYVEMAASEVLIHARHLQDPDTGLWYHGWDAERGDNMSGANWARGNGWVALAMTELLARLPEGHPQRDQVRVVLDRQLTALADCQAASGLWHTVVTRPDFYLETSGSAAIAAAMLRAAGEGWVDEDLAVVGRRARTAVQGKVGADGSVRGVSSGTGVAPTIEVYNRIRTDLVKPYGQGLYLIMATAAGGR